MASSSTRFSVPAPEAIRVLVILLEDESNIVREASSSALKDIASRSPILVLDSCFALYRGRRRRFANVAGLFQVMACGVRSLENWEVEHTFMGELAKIAVVEATSVKDVSADCQMAVSGLLVSVGSQLPDVMMDEVISHLSGSSSGIAVMIQVLADFASDNALEFAPRLKIVLSRVLPILGNVKDVHRSIFANAFKCWCEAVLQYGVDFPAHSFLDGDVVSFLHSAFELFLRVWAASRETKVRITTVEALGQMVGLITHIQLKAALPRLIPTIIDLYKKDPDVILRATCTLHNLLNSSLLLDTGPPLLDFEDVTVILSTLLRVIGTINDEKDHSNFSFGLKTYNEAQHCFIIVGKVYHGDLLIFLLNKCRLKEEPLIFGSLSVLKHLLPRLSELWQKKRPMLVEAVKMLLDEQDLCVRIAISELILVMASHCYLVGLDGELFIEYLARNCSVEYKSTNNGGISSAISLLDHQHKRLEVKHGVVSIRELREICEKGLLLLTVTVPDIERLLWPFLLKMVVPQIYTGAVATLCQCIAELCRRRSPSCRMMITECQTRADIPSPENLLARMIVLLHDPLSTDLLAVHIFTALCYLAPIFPKNVNIFWQEEVPKLKAYISDTEDLIRDPSFQETWDDMIINFLAESMDVINDERWMVSLGNAFASQYELYAPNDDHIALLHCCLGIILQNINDKNFVRGKIDWMYKQANIACPSNRLGLAKAIGLVAASHLDNVLEKLKAILDSVGQNFFRRIFLVFSDRALMESDDIHAALALMYGYAAKYAPSTVIEARIDALVGTNMLGRLLHVKSPMAKQAVITAIDLLGRAVISAAESGISFPLKRRNQLLDYVLTLMGRDDNDGSHDSNSEHLQTQALAISACTTLVTVEPKLSIDTQNIVMKATLGFFALPSEPSAVINPLVDILITLLCAILQMSCEDASNQAEKLLYLLREVNRFIFSVNDYQRRRVCHAVRELVLKFRSLCLPGYSMSGRHSSLMQSIGFDHPSRGKYVLPTRHSLCNGEWVIVYLPHCADVNADVRKVCSEILALFFGISLSLQKPLEVAFNENLELSYTALSSLEGVIAILKSDAAIDPSEVFDRVLASICVLLTKEELVVALHNCAAAICDNIKHAAEGTIQAVVEFVANRGNELDEMEISGTAQALISAAGHVADKHLQHETICAISSLAEITSYKIVFREVLSATTEMDVNTKVVSRLHCLQEIFHAFSQHSTLSSLFLQHVITVLGQTPVIRSETQGASHSIDQNEVLKASILALTSFFRGGSKVCRKASGQNYSSVLAVLLHKFGSLKSLSCCGQQDILRSLLTAFQAFCECVGDLEMGKILGREGLRSYNEKWVDVVGDLASCIYTKRSKEVPNICMILIRCLNNNDVIEKGSAVASLSEFIRYCDGFGTLLDDMVEVLSQHVSDVSPTIRRHCISGLMQIPSSKIPYYSTQILPITLALFEDFDETVQVMSLSCLLMVLDSSPREVLEPLLLNISDRLSILQASMNTMIRANAFVAFGSLANYGTGAQRESFLEQVHAAIPGLVLHLYDEDLSVRHACRRTLRRVIPLLETEDLVKLLSSQSFNSDFRNDYQDFVRDFTRQLCLHLAFRLDAYITTTIQAYDAPWSIVQANAIYLSTCLLSFSDNQHVLALHFTEVFGLLMGKMSQSADAVVRSSSSVALGLLLKSTNHFTHT